MILLWIMCLMFMCVLTWYEALRYRDWADWLAAGLMTFATLACIFMWYAAETGLAL